MKNLFENMFINSVRISWDIYVTFLTAISPNNDHNYTAQKHSPKTILLFSDKGRRRSVLGYVTVRLVLFNPEPRFTADLNEELKDLFSWVCFFRPELKEVQNIIGGARRKCFISLSTTYSSQCNKCIRSWSSNGYKVLISVCRTLKSHWQY